MQLWKITVLAPAIMLAVACNRNDDRVAADTALNNDLNLASQVAPPLDSLSAIEAGYAPGAASAPRTTARSSSPTPTRRTTTRSSSSASSGRVVTSSGGNVSSAPRTVTVKHTKRDAAIGAAAGAVIGATTSRDKVKGAIIGGVVGGVLGGVIGNNVDKKKKPVPPQQ
jgi:hypothetical protein